jgi:hypothetical protein
MLTPLPEAITSKSGFGQVKIMKEFVWIDRNCFLKFAFWQVGEKIKAKTATTNIYVKKYFLIPKKEDAHNYAMKTYIDVFTI